MTALLGQPAVLLKGDKMTNNLEIANSLETAKTLRKGTGRINLASFQKHSFARGNNGVAYKTCEYCGISYRKWKVDNPKCK